jgi:hypothetical protein
MKSDYVVERDYSETRMRRLLAHRSDKLNDLCNDLSVVISLLTTSPVSKPRHLVAGAHQARAIVSRSVAALRRIADEDLGNKATSECDP